MRYKEELKLQEVSIAELITKYNANKLLRFYRLHGSGWLDETLSIFKSPDWSIERGSVDSHSGTSLK